MPRVHFPAGQLADFRRSPRLSGSGHGTLNPPRPRAHSVISDADSAASSIFLLHFGGTYAKFALNGEYAKSEAREGDMTDAYPLQWPFSEPRNVRPQRSRFDVAFAKARNELMREIALLGGTLPVISTNIPLRRDGLPYAGQKEPDDRGVAVYFMLKETPMCFACDRWDRVGDNIQAIRHTVAALRGIERWGTGEMVQQAFRGFAALPSPENPYDVLGVSRSASRKEIDVAFREKAKQVHPDCGGSTEEMQKLNEAKRQVIEKLKKSA